MVKLDFENFFDCAARAQLSAKCDPAWLVGCSGLSKLERLFGNHTIDSSIGVQQGDPLGRLLFSLVVQPLAEELRAFSHHGKKLDLTFFFLDDGVAAGDLECLAAALRAVEL